MPESIIENIKDTGNSLLEVTKERFFSPMYFYFIIAWIITNWEFTYVLFFANEEYLKIPKIIILTHLYDAHHLWDYIWNACRLVFIPAISAYLAVWWLSMLSERFYEKYEQYKINKTVIKRKLDYTAKVQEANEKRTIRDIEADKKKINYEDNSDFNDYLDDGNDDIEVLGITMRPSEVLYNNDYEAYRAELETWKQDQLDRAESIIEDEIIERNRSKVIQEYKDDLKAEHDYQEMRDRGL